MADGPSRLDPAGDTAVPRLVELLGPGARGQRVNAALALGCLGGAAGSAQASPGVHRRGARDTARSTGGRGGAMHTTGQVSASNTLDTRPRSAVVAGRRPTTSRSAPHRASRRGNASTPPSTTWSD